MSAKAGLKAGLIGAAVILVLTLLNQVPVPVLSCACCGITLLAYAGIGVLAGLFVQPPRTGGAGAGAGAIAGLISGLVAAIVWSIVMAIGVASGGTGNILSQLDPQTLRQLSELGLDPRVFAIFSGVGGVALRSGMCCAFSLAWGAGVAALGGLVFCSVKPE